ncbi:transketolase [Candidatus Saccharibacteria bacterium]|nr:MAG: transketolase [Candidatus Saccharibacteria bacterium]
MFLKLDSDQLAAQANQLRRDVISMVSHAGSGHPAGALGLADIFASLYFNILNHNPKDPYWSRRDMLFVSNGHVAPIVYSALARSGYFEFSQLGSLRKLGSSLQGHPERTKLPGIESTSGPLGSGLSQAAGYAYSLHYLDHDSDRQVYCVVSDGELDEGNSWEAVMFASKYRLGKLTVIVDRNNIQISGKTEQVMPLEDLARKWQAFNWHTQIVDGHDIVEVIEASHQAKNVTDHPSVIIAQTIPGKGVDFMENDYRWHGKAPNPEQTEQALTQLMGKNLEVDR